jgi:hypothetical protein
MYASSLKVNSHAALTVARKRQPSPSLDLCNNAALSRQLSWTHLRSLIYIDDSLKREFYLEMCRSEGWSTRTLQGRLDSMLFERTALSRKPDELLTSELATLREQGVLGPNFVLKAMAALLAPL